MLTLRTAGPGSPARLAPARLRGVTLIEMMVGLAILSILLFLGVPSFTTFIQNAKLRSKTETLLAGLLAARVEAVRRNGPVQFILTDDEAVVTNAQTTNLSPTGSGWIIRVLDTTTGLYTFVEGKSGFEGTGKQQSSTPDVLVNGGAVSSITFNGLGGTNLGGAATFQLTNPTGGACAPTGPMRCLTVVVSVGGQARMCDPAVTAAGDTRKC